MAGHGVAANLLMLFIVAAGLVSLTGLVQEVFPEFSTNQIRISVRYPGATPEEVEESIVRKIEEQIGGVEGIDGFSSTAAEGRGSVVVDLEDGANASRVLDDVKSVVDRIQTFPARAERPEVVEATNRQSVVQLVLHGDVSERALKELAYRTEDELAALPAVSYVETRGVRPYEISIEVPLRRLRALGLSLQDVTAAVRAGSLDLSAGTIETQAERVRIRTTGQNYRQHDFEEIVVLSRADGTVVRLGEIAVVRDGFQDADLVSRYQGRPAAFVDVYRTSSERVLDVASAVEEHLANHVAPSLPPGVEIEVWNNSADLFRDRLGVLRKNAFLGLLLVLAALTLFLELRLAAWVAVGIAVSFMGTFAVMLALGISINMLSMFAFILAVGIVVDDAVVVSENIFAERQRGADGVAAAVRGAERIKGPVVFGVLTTIAAFSPLLFLPGMVGKLMGAIPVIVISVLLLSLVESLLVLPAHLSHLSPPGAPPAGNPVARFLSAARAGVDRQMKRFAAGPLDRAVRVATGRPLLVIATGAGMVLLCLAAVPAGIIGVAFFPTTEADVVRARLEMPVGTTGTRTTEVARALEEAGLRAVRRMSEGRPPDALPVVAGVNFTVGHEARPPNPLDDDSTEELRANIAAVEFKLQPADERDVSAASVVDAWREEAAPVEAAAGPSSLMFSAELLNLGPPVQVGLSHPDPQVLARAGVAVADALRSLEGVYDIRTDQDQGFKEIRIELLPEARTLGVTLEGLARQVRAAFFGDEALRVQRGREDVRVYVRLPEDERDAVASVEQHLVRTPAGAEVPLGRVASLRFGSSPATIRRQDGWRVVAVTASVNTGTTTAGQVVEHLEASVLPVLADQEPGLAWWFSGEQQEQAESFGAMGRGFVMALLAIYALLAIPFRSYTKPLIVMSAIPFGIVGAVLGHLFLGLDLSALSFLGIVGLGGVVVNDALVMIDFVTKRMEEGMPGREAIVAGAKARFRPIFLTSLTTFLGVAPLVFERSLQAQFLVPMAASLGFGIVFATVVLMMIVPALAMIHHDAGEWWRSRARGVVR